MHSTEELGNIWSRNRSEEKFSATSTTQDDNGGIHHEHMGAANKSDVSPNTPKADEADL